MTGPYGVRHCGQGQALSLQSAAAVIGCAVGAGIARPLCDSVATHSNLTVIQSETSIASAVEESHIMWLRTPQFTRQYSKEILRLRFAALRMTNPFGGASLRATDSRPYRGAAALIGGVVGTALAAVRCVILRQRT